MATSWSTPGGAADWSAPSGWLGRNQSGQIPTAGQQPQTAGMWGTYRPPMDPNAGMSLGGYNQNQTYTPTPQNQMYQQPPGAAPNAAKAKNDPGSRPPWWPPGWPWPGSSGDGGGLFSGGNQNITQTFEPWGPQGEQIKKMYGLSEAEYKRQMALGAPKFSQESNQALDRMAQMVGGRNPLVNQALDAVQNVSSGDKRIQTGGMFGDLYQKAGGPGNAQQYNQLYDDPGIDQGGYQQMANRNAITNEGQFNEIYHNGMDPGLFNNLYAQNQGGGGLGGGMFGNIAQGSLVGANPYREQNIKQSMGDTAAQIKASMSKAGRYGSDAYGSAMGKALSSVATQAREAGYNQDTANMMAAAQARSGETLARGGLAQQAAQGRLSTDQSNQANRLAAAQAVSNIQGQNAQQQLAALQGLTGAQAAIGQQRLGAAQGLTGLQGQQMQNQLAAAQGQTGVQSQNIQNQMQAAGMTPEMQKLRYDDMNRMLGIGATREAMTQQQRNFGWDQLAQRQGFIGGLPGQAGSSQQTTQQPWWQQAAGLGMLGMGMFGQ